ncbi:bifunctional alpha,alpha-trehalose-phosphate synthase (UDP-forming)/trehalose-phosphatase [Solitalea canadensis]|uniref:Alpha,alpha-trehalose-phosphate synthase n=1 Tax=Solitalea canadensis (strain ATCC 29591 / DSM 3403 / JCM 21819 / LMG 8368 / NBRC 15130 / NCIMB 12057 / USAM 9D) TaxID=929556 RepID=H8KQW5_SOLCM|nr:bifunctional alpha,alpha-trehalose-phosphate synthase (UDP-forming)/trehalose-phosphatase [Solitalea canadensis]AFD07111.1 UDP-forming alpha,alpha-trehalose-phosphate synthase [Solitalea canadensis DSM 3403]
MNKSKTIIVSNRLPVKITFNSGQIAYQNSEGGLATGLGSIYRTGNNIWIGWPGAIIEDDMLKEQVSVDLKEKSLFPVFLSDEEINKYYEGFSNETLWPLFHYFPSYARYSEENWESYKAVNQKFADIVLANLKNGDQVWIHDYQLMLVPQMIRSKMQDVSIGFFLHIPFPSFEVFRLLPWRAELIKGVIGADLIGFHTFDDSKYFINSCQRILGLTSINNQLYVNDLPVIVDAFPISIDYVKYNELASNKVLKQHEDNIIRRKGEAKLMISVDRLDYSKGLINRLKAFDQLLSQFPKYKEKVVFVQLVVPSRDTVKQYSELKEEVDRLVSDINARYGTLNWQPIQYFYRSFSIELLSALYKTADIALVTPMRDGMNLVSKEYVASKIDKKGVLVLSEMAGASRELNDAIIINPNDQISYVNALVQALEMPDEEQLRRMTAMQEIVARFNIFHWVKVFMQRLEDAKTLQRRLSVREISPLIQEMIGERYLRAEKRLLFLDYDGTLVDFNNNPLLAWPDWDLLQLLEMLIADPKNTVVLISGRKQETLEEWFGKLNMNIVAEHGAWIKRKGKDWTHHEIDVAWKEDVYNIMQAINERTPRSFIEDKSYSVAWHYRNVEVGLAELRAKELVENLKYLTADRGLQIMHGNKVIEVKSAEINKGKAAKKWTDRHSYEFILAIGDDHTDEDTFKAMPKNAVNIKVGSTSSVAAFYLHSPNDVRLLLKNLVKEQIQENVE